MGRGMRKSGFVDNSLNVIYQDIILENTKLTANQKYLVKLAYAKNWFKLSFHLIELKFNQIMRFRMKPAHLSFVLLFELIEEQQWKIIDQMLDLQLIKHTHLDVIRISPQKCSNNIVWLLVHASQVNLLEKMHQQKLLTIDNLSHQPFDEKGIICNAILYLASQSCFNPLFKKLLDDNLITADALATHDILNDIHEANTFGTLCIMKNWQQCEALLAKNLVTFEQISHQYTDTKSGKLISIMDLIQSAPGEFRVKFEAYCLAQLDKVFHEESVENFREAFHFIMQQTLYRYAEFDSRAEIQILYLATDPALKSSEQRIKNIVHNIQHCFQVQNTENLTAQRVFIVQCIVNEIQQAKTLAEVADIINLVAGMNDFSQKLKMFFTTKSLFSLRSDVSAWEKLHKTIQIASEKRSTQLLEQQGVSFGVAG